MCVAAHGRESVDGPPETSNCYCLPGRAGGFPFIIKQRTNVVQIFSSEAAVIRLAGALLLEQNDEWMASRSYMSLETLAV